MWQKMANTVLLIIIAGLIVFNIFNLIEAYGSGPPYYSRTTNMDKWENPLPTLFSIDAVAIAVIALSFIIVNKRK